MQPVSKHVIQQENQPSIKAFKKRSLLKEIYEAAIEFGFETENQDADQAVKETVKSQATKRKNSVVLTENQLDLTIETENQLVSTAFNSMAQNEFNEQISKPEKRVKMSFVEPESQILPRIKILQKIINSQE